MRNLDQPEAVTLIGGKSNRADTLLLVGVLIGLWSLVFNALRVDWSINPQYSYGWSIPLLSLGLFWRRWPDRPDPAASAVGLPRTLAILLLFALLPIRSIEEANPEWRLILWVHAVQMVLLSFCALLHLGGGRWVRHFFFPIVFVLVAVPWPMPLEQKIIQSLMRFVAAVTVEATGLLGIPALQHGNLIEISGGLVGIDEACSGVRSLQTTLMVSLFLGELYRFATARRLVLLLAGFGVAVLANLGRTIFLVWAAARHGNVGLQQWHDAAGVAVMLLVFAALWACAVALRRPLVHPAPAMGEATAVHAAAPDRFFPRALLIGVAGWIGAVEAATESWYRAHESPHVEKVHWSVAWPETSPGFRALEISTTVRAMLRCDAARGAIWRDEQANHWLLFLLEWSPGRNSAQLAHGHTPDICLPAAGRRLVNDLGPQIVSLGGLDLSFHQFVFEQAGRPLHVFHCLWEEHAVGVVPPLQEDRSQASRLLAVRHGKRHRGQQVIEVAVAGPADPPAALAALRQELDQRIRR